MSTNTPGAERPPGQRAGKPNPLSGRTQRRLLRQLVERADAGDAEAACALLRVSLAATAARWAERAAAGLLVGEGGGNAP